MFNYFTKRKAKQKVMLYWYMEKIKAASQAVLMTQFVNVANQNCGSMESEIKKLQDELKPLEESHKYEDRMKRKEIEDKLKGLFAKLEDQKKEIAKSEDVKKKSDQAESTADTYLYIIKRLKLK